MLELFLVDPCPHLATEIEALFGKGKATRLEIASVPDLDGAVARCRTRPPACAFVSSALLTLDERSELEAQIAGFGETPVIVLAEPEHARAAPRVLAAGADDWVPKSGPLFVGLPRFLAYTLERAELRRNLRELRERQRADQRLFHALMDNTPVAVLALDGDGRVAHCNRGAGELLDRPIGRIEGRRFEDFLAPSSRCVLTRLAAAPASEEESETPVELVTASGPEKVRLRHCVVPSGTGGVWRLVWLVPESREVAPAPPSDPDDALRRALREVLAKGDGRLPMARIHLLGLDELRTALGERWDEFEAQVRDVVERVLRSQLGPGERFCREAELGYMIIFGGGDERHAAARIAAIEEAVRAAVLGAEELAERGRLQRPPLSGEAYERLATLETSIEEIPIGAEDLAAEADLWEVLRARSHQGGPGGATHPAGIMAELRKTAHGEYEPALDGDGVPAPILLLAFDPRTHLQVERYRRKAGQDPTLLFELDKFVLERHLLLLMEELRMGSDVALVDVHYETLASRCGGDAYMALLEEIPDDLRAVLGFNICGVPPGVYAPKVARLVSALRPFCRLQAVEVDIRRPELPDLPTIRAPMVTVPFHAPAGSEAPCNERFRTLLNRAHACKVRVLVRRVPRGWSACLRERYPVDFTCLA